MLNPGLSRSLDKTREATRTAASGDLPRLNVLDLEIRHGFKNRVPLIQLDMERQPNPPLILLRLLGEAVVECQGVEEGENERTRIKETP